MSSTHNGVARLGGMHQYGLIRVAVRALSAGVMKDGANGWDFHGPSHGAPTIATASETKGDVGAL